jgi:ribosome-binding protein aMBF1 (putative translation factor)
MSEPTYGEIIRAAREAKGWSNRKLAAEANVSDSTSFAAENGRNKPTIKTRVKLETALGLSITHRKPEDPPIVIRVNADGPLVWSHEWAVELRKHREAQGWTTQELANKAGTTASHLYMVESGRRIPRLDVAMSLSDVLGMAIEW